MHHVRAWIWIGWNKKNITFDVAFESATVVEIYEITYPRPSLKAPSRLSLCVPTKMCLQILALVAYLIDSTAVIYDHYDL